MLTPLILQFPYSALHLKHPFSLRPRFLLQWILISSFGSKSIWNSNSNLTVKHPVLSRMETCTSMAELKQIHAHMIRTGLITHLLPVSRILAFCTLSDSGNMDHAHLVFAQIKEPNIFIWNTMINGYARSKNPSMGFSLFNDMVGEGVAGDNRTFVFAIKACEQFPSVMEGEELHCRILKVGFDSDLRVQNSLIHMYVNHGWLVYARQVFDESSVRDVVSWTTMIDGYAQRNLPDEALKFFYLMLSNNVEPNEVTMITVLSACSQIGLPNLGRYIHDFIEKHDVNLTINLLNAILDMYIKCGCIDIARELFDRMKVRDVFSWTSMINGNAKWGDLKLARQLFDEMPERNAISWSTMIAGYSQSNQPKEALNLFHEMVAACIRPIEGTLVSVLSACAQSSDLDFGRWIHHHFLGPKRVKLSTIIANALIEMYAKCGSLDMAMKVFNETPQKDLVSWNSIITAYAVHGHGAEALLLFEKMKNMGIVPDDITFIGVLSACSHGGLVEEGHKYFTSMRKVFDIEPKVEHFTCMIDLLGRVGLLEEANGLIRSMPIEPDVAGWGALLSACRMHGNVELGELAADKLLGLDPEDSGIYALLSNIYAMNRRWDDVKRIRTMMRTRSVKKAPGCSSIEVDGIFNEFLVADKSHPQSKEIYHMLDEVLMQLKLEGYMPNTSQLMGLHEISEDILLPKRTKLPALH